MRELLDWFMQANKGMAAVTVVAVQIIKLWLPGNGEGRFSVAESWKKILLPATFLIAVSISVYFDPHPGEPLKIKIGEGLQTGGLAVVMWEIYSNWVRPFVFPTKASP
jgi:hypothetical protein